MGRKRATKKKDKRREDRLRGLETLFLTGRDDEFLRHVVEVDDLVGIGMDGAYLEVLDRSLARRLQDGDVDGLESLLERVRPEAEASLMVRLARAVLHLDQGELGEAAAILAELGRDGDGAAWPPLLLQHLQVLAGSMPGSTSRRKDQDPRLTDFAKLQRSLGRLGSGEIQRLPGQLKLHWDEARDAFALARAMTALDNRDKPSKVVQSRALDRLVLAVDSLRGRRFWDGATEQLLQASLQLARAAGAIEDFEGDTQPGYGLPGELGLEDAFDTLEEEGDRFSGLLDPNLPEALARLRHGLVSRLLTALGALVEEHGIGILGRAWAAGGEALTPLFETPPSGEEGIGAAAREAHLLFGRGEYLDLASLLRREGSKTRDLHRLSRLWGLELAILRRAAREEEAGLSFDLGWEEEAESRALERMLSRLRAMSRALPQLAVGDESRVRLAHLLIRELLAVAGDLEIGKGFLPVALQLLEFVPQEPRLLVLTLDVAHHRGGRRVIAELEERIEARGQVAESEVDAIVDLLTAPATREMVDVERFYRSARPLLGEHWDGAQRRIYNFLRDRAFGAASMALAHREICCEEGAEIGLSKLRGELEVFRPLFGTLPEYEISELMVSRILAGSSEIERLAAAFLDRHGELEAAVAATWWAHRFDELGIEIGRTLSLALRAMTGRLDHRWPIWSSIFASTLHSQDEQGLVLARSRLESLVQDRSLEKQDRVHLMLILDLVSELLSELRPGRRGRKRKKRSARRSSKASSRMPDPQLPLF